MKSKKLIALGVVLAAVTGVSMAQSGGGCLQGTWTYYDDEGAPVGYQVVGCGDQDGTVGEVTSNRSFSQGCGVAAY